MQRKFSARRPHQISTETRPRIQDASPGALDRGQRGGVPHARHFGLLAALSSLLGLTTGELDFPPEELVEES